MLASKIEDLTSTIASLKEHVLAADIIPDHQVALDANGDVLDLASHAGKVELHQRVTTVIHMRDESGQISTTFEIDHQYFNGSTWVYRTEEEVVAEVKRNLDRLLTVAAESPHKNPEISDLVLAVKARNDLAKP